MVGSKQSLIIGIIIRYMETLPQLQSRLVTKYFQYINLPALFCLHASYFSYTVILRIVFFSS